MSKTKVAFYAPVDIEKRLAAVAKIAASNDLLEFVLVDLDKTPEENHTACEGAEVFITPNIVTVNEVAEGIKGLKLIQTFSAGTDELDKAKLLNLGIKVANNGGANAVAVAEHAVWMLLTVNHKFDKQIESVKAGTWRSGVPGDLTEFTSLVDKQVGIVGLGRIGSRVAKRLQGWECNVVYHDTIEFDADYVAATGASQMPLDELIATSDIITLHVPLDRVTEKMFSTEQFKAMKNTAVLINTCRGPVVDESALIEALRNGEIWGAGLDVTEVEPIQPDNPLIGMPNVVLTPHTGTKVIQSDWNANINVVANAERVAQGLEPDWVVDPV
tara:strand:+ start:382 stop:1368 length:987 start_codon:yes stop_codon:yes gene_type:complete